MVAESLPSQHHRRPRKDSGGIGINRGPIGWGNGDGQQRDVVGLAAAAAFADSLAAVCLGNEVVGPGGGRSEVGEGAAEFHSRQQVGRIFRRTNGKFPQQGVSLIQGWVGGEIHPILPAACRRCGAVIAHGECRLALGAGVGGAHGRELADHQIRHVDVGDIQRGCPAVEACGARHDHDRLGAVTHSVIDATDGERGRFLPCRDGHRGRHHRFAGVARGQVDRERRGGGGVAAHGGCGGACFGNHAAIQAQREAGALIIEHLQAGGGRATGQHNGAVGIGGPGRDGHGLRAIDECIVHRQELHRSGRLIGGNEHRCGHRGFAGVAAAQQHLQRGVAHTAARHRERGLPSLLQDGSRAALDGEGHQITGLHCK